MDLELMIERQYGERQYGEPMNIDDQLENQPIKLKAKNKAKEPNSKQWKDEFKFTPTKSVK